MKTILRLIAALLLAGATNSARADEVSIPDPGLNAAIRTALGKPSGPLTDLDLLSLTNLDAHSRNVRSTAGLEAARNLVSLDLTGNSLTNFFLPSELTNLTSLTMEGCALTNLTLPATLLGLTNLDVEGNDLSSFEWPSNLASLVALDLGFNSFTNFSVPSGLTNLTTFYFAGNPLTNVTLPPDLASMSELNLSQNLLTTFTLPTGMTNLSELDFAFNQLTNLILPADLRNLTELDLDFNRLSALNFPANLTSLGSLHLRSNQFTNFSLPTELTSLTYLDVSEGPLRAITLPTSLNHLRTLRIAGNTNLTSLTVPVGLTNLTALYLAGNQLTSLVLPPDLGRLEWFDVGGNQLTSLSMPSGLTNLVDFFVGGNLLTNITLPPDMAQVDQFGYLSNPLATVVLSEVNATNLAADVAFLRNQGVSVYTYPPTVQLIRLRQPIGAFQFAITGPPGVYTVFSSINLTDWSVLRDVTNPLGAIVFTDVTANLSPQKFYRALRQTPPANMAFVAPNTFTMGSPTNDPQRSIFEGPQTTVTLTHGFWIGKYEVTQGEYLEVMGTNPSDFPGDLSRPVSSVAWFDATNYCWKLTQQELAAGRIPTGSQYRLPTEAEWECAARAGTSTRFSYGDDDPNDTNLTNYAWFLDLGHPDLTVHPVGQKLPNASGLYDMYGNVWEWCQDWYGDQLGGVQTDPTGPASNPDGLKVMRGGAYDYPNSSCRSASRLFRFLTWPDSDLGFRVVLVTGP
jgi:formylglycine-generating enzyme required for sulfatase activity